MICIRTYKAEDFDNIEAQEAQLKEFIVFNPDTCDAYTIYDDASNEIYCILVFTPLSKDRCMISSLISKGAGKHFIGMRKIIFQMLELYKFTRLECMVRTSFPQGHRLVKLLGFSFEGTLRKFFKNQDYSMYARVL